MMETQGWIVPCEKEDSRIDRCQCSGTRIITRAVIRDGIEFGDASISYRTLFTPHTALDVQTARRAVICGMVCQVHVVWEMEESEEN